MDLTLQRSAAVAEVALLVVGLVVVGVWVEVVLLAIPARIILHHSKFSVV